MESLPLSALPIARRLGELLVEAGLVMAAQIDRAVTEGSQTGEPVGKILVKRGLLTEDQLGKMLGIQAGTEYIKIEDREIDPELLGLFPQDFLLRHKVLPLSVDKSELQVAMVHPNDFDTLDEIRLITGLKPRPFVTTSKEFDDRFTSLMGTGQQEVSDAIASIRKEALQEQTPQQQQRMADELAVEDQPVVRLLNSILSDSISRNASDIHFDSREKGLRVRFRIDGVMHDSTDIPKDLEAQLISRLKVMGSMDIAERRKPQDGRARYMVAGRQFDLRIHMMPNIWGEKAVVRILRPAMLLGGMGNIGLYPETTAMIRDLIESPHGIVLVTGPTGSGKTTTLYSALYEMNSPDRTLFTVEDPVEFPLEGVSQTQINPKAGFHFADALRALLRQDPDVIMVGEIRDKETLDAAVHAALTGHLVLSTIHTNDSVSTPVRMVEMGLPPYLLTSTVRGIVAQRLVRKLCTYCRVELEPDGAVPEILQGRTLYRGKGCTRCRETGFAGRIGLFEVLPLTNSLQELINGGAPAYRLREAANKEGLKGMADDALRKVLDGTTNHLEVVRALGNHWTDMICQPSSIAP